MGTSNCINNGVSLNAFSSALNKRHDNFLAILWAFQLTYRIVLDFSALQENLCDLIKLWSLPHFKQGVELDDLSPTYIFLCFKMEMVAKRKGKGTIKSTFQGEIQTNWYLPKYLVEVSSENMYPSGFWAEVIKLNSAFHSVCKVGLT